MKINSAFISKLALITFLSTTSNTALASLVAGGSFRYQNKFEKFSLPLLLTSTDNGQSWTQTSHIANLPSNMIDGYIADIHCAQKICIAGGEYTLNVGNEKHHVNIDYYLLLTSTDAGHSWKFVPGIDAHANRYENEITKITCSNNTCVAAGVTYSDTDKTFEFFISQDSGLSWTPSKKFSSIPDHRVTFHKINDVDCNNDVCIAVGQSSDRKEKKRAVPLLLTSCDAGKTWTLKSNQFISGLEKKDDIFINQVRAADIFGNPNIAIGHYYANPNTSIFDVTSDSFILISNDNGGTWKTINKIVNLPACNVYDITKASCNANACIAIGNYKYDYTPMPLVLLSQDKGVTWTSIKTTDAPNGDLKNSYCDANKCIIAGLYNPDPQSSKTLPVILVSDAKGESWKSIRQIDQLPSHNIFENTSSITCTNHHCVIGGYYFKESDKNQFRHPFFLNSQDDGNTWTYVSNTVDIPQNAYAAQINVIDTVD